MLNRNGSSADRNGWRGAAWTTVFLIVSGGWLPSAIAQPEPAERRRRSDVSDRQENQSEPSAARSAVEHELEALRDELKTLRERREAAREKVSDVANQRKRVELALAEGKMRTIASNEKLEKLRSQIADIEPWQQATFVLGNADGDVAAALKLEGDEARLIAVAQGGAVRDRVYTAANASIPFEASQAARDLARKIARAQLQRNDKLPQELKAELHEKFWRPVSAPVWSQADQPTFVVFRESDSPRQKLGILCEIKGNILRYAAVGTGVQEVERERIEPGSLRANLGADILDAVEADRGFTDYCALSIVDRLWREGTNPSHHAVGIQVSLNGAFKSLAEVTHTHVNKYSRTPSEALELVAMRSPELFDNWIGVAALGLNGIGFDIKEVIHTPDAEAELKRAARKVEDELYTRLSQCGMTLIDKHHFDRQRERLSDQYGNLSTAAVGKAVGAKYLVTCNVDVTPGQGVPFVRVNVQLVDTKTGKALWVANSGELCPRIDDKNPFFPVSGSLAVMGSLAGDNNSEYRELQALESPLKVEFTQVGVTLPKEQLVLLESPETADPLIYRSLFDRQMHQIPRKLASTNVLSGGITDVLTEQDFQPHFVRAIVWHLASQSLTPAGRITEVLDGGKSFRVSIGSLQGLTSDSTLRCFRPRSTLSQNANETQDVPLPIALAVRSVSDSSCIVNPRRVGLNGYWEDDSVMPRVGDLVYDPTLPKRKMAVFPPEDRSGDLSDKEKARVAGGNVRNWQNVVADQLALANVIQRKLVSGFTSLDSAYEDKGNFDEIRISNRRSETTVRQLNVSETVRKARLNGATHAIGGYIKPTGTRENVRYEVELRLFQLGIDQAGQGVIEETKVAIPKLLVGRNGWK
jgi:hypothetical protein